MCCVVFHKGKFVDIRRGRDNTNQKGKKINNDQKNIIRKLHNKVTQYPPNDIEKLRISLISMM